jgi:hypothetical protein
MNTCANVVPIPCQDFDAEDTYALTGHKYPHGCGDSRCAQQNQCESLAAHTEPPVYWLRRWVEKPLGAVKVCEESKSNEPSRTELFCNGRQLHSTPSQSRSHRSGVLASPEITKRNTFRIRIV